MGPLQNCLSPKSSKNEMKKSAKRNENYKFSTKIWKIAQNLNLGKFYFSVAIYRILIYLKLELNNLHFEHFWGKL